MKKKVLFTLGFFGVVVILHLILRQTRYSIVIDIDNFWPISLMLPKIPRLVDGITLGAIACFGWLYWQEFKKNSGSIWRLFGLAMVITFLSNLLQGWQQGFVSEVVGFNSYWNDALHVANPIEFVRYFNQLQSSLTLHSSSHPPGPVLFSFMVQRVFGQPFWFTIITGVIGLMSGVLVYWYLAARIKKEVAFKVAGLFLALPAINIYTMGGIDAVVLTTFFATVYLWMKKGAWNFVAALAMLYLSAMLNFAVIFLIPVLLVADWVQTGSIKRFVGLLVLLLGILLLQKYVLGFDYMASFLQATQVDRIQTSSIYHPISYLVTRFENILELLLFFTPILSLFLIQAIAWLKPWRLSSWKKESIVGVAAIVSLMGFYATGAYATGETARNCMYIYPFLLLILGYFWDKHDLQISEWNQLLVLVLGQSVLMQLFGFYYW